MADAFDNPRAQMGDNTADAPDYAKQEVKRLQEDYGELVKTIDGMEAEAEALPAEIAGPDAKEVVVDLIKRSRDAKVRTLALHEVEKQPHFRRGQGVDQFFFGLVDRTLKREKKNRDGFADRLNQMLTDYDVRVLAEEQEKRRKEFEAAEAIRIKAERERIERERLAEEARLAAERARKPETTAAKQGVAEQAEAQASAARVDETVAAARAEDLYIPTLARPADIMRTRTGGGTLSTMAEEPYAEIEKQELLDMAKLWPYIPLAAKQTALNSWAKSTGHNEPMAGAKIGRRPKSRVR